MVKYKENRSVLITNILQFETGFGSEKMQHLATTL
jgi:hypothetical protein